MSKFIILLSLILSGTANAKTLAAYSGQTLQGTEQINEHSTGNICYVVIRDVVDKSNKGHHCYDIEAQFAFNNNNVSKDHVFLMSRVTNYHRSEYPGIKSCAANVNGKTSEQDIYENNTEILYTPFFSADAKMGATQYDYFISIDPVTKMPSRARLHILKPFSETNYDCVNLKSPKHYQTPKDSGHVHDNANQGDHGDHNDPIQQPGQKPENCDLWFSHHEICGRIYFLNTPKVNQDSPFQLVFTDKNNQLIDHPPVFSDLWMNMGHHGHGSAPITTNKLTTGIYRTENVYFVMKGKWQVRVTLGHSTSHAETDIYEVLVN